MAKAWMHTRHIRVHTLGVNEQPCATVVSDHSDPSGLCLALRWGTCGRLTIHVEDHILYLRPLSHLCHLLDTDPTESDMLTCGLES